MQIAHPFVLVDDSLDDLPILKRLLIRAGVKNPFLTFDHPNEVKRFIDAAARFPETNFVPAAIFSDKLMLGMVAFEFLRCLRTQFPLRRVPSVMLSITEDADDERRARAAGATAFFEKFLPMDVFAEMFGLKAI